MPAPDRIKQLVETFEKNINDYRFNKNETELRRQFLDPFFEALGWDVDNKQGKDERHKEVAHEYSVEIDGQQKKADYAFRTEKDIFNFLVEAKKPSVKVESNPDAAFQIRSYGWSAKLPINILTDFEHFAIYDCRIRPNYAKDDAKTGRIAIFDYKEYVERWDEIVNLFSPDAIRNGALAEYSDGLKTKKGTQEVDDAFLEEIEGWREALAKNIAIRNKDKNLNEEQINFAVQMTIDRIVFLRICEDRGIERNDQLKDVGTGSGVYEALCRLFQKADDRYNSGLFHFKKDKERENPDTLSAQINIDDKVLKDIIKDLYYPSPYAFTYIPTEILGSVYERFLGKVIRLTAGGNAKVEEKPEVRKAGGVYYTPSYIVEYIVKNTVGKLLGSPRPLGEERGGEGDLTPNPSPERRGGLTHDEVSKIKIVDPACGSGSFLLGAYQFLLDWHLDYYASNGPEKWVKNKTLLTPDNKTYRLSIDEKKRILLNNIHGVDLDPQAVEVTKLSLLLKVVEDPGQLKMFEEGHILPNLNKNIKNGNALIGTDYFNGQMFGDMEEMKRVKPFDWNSEFPEIFKRGGFDVVVGNPPYVLGRETFDEKTKVYLSTKYIVYGGKYDLYIYFTERAISLIKPSGKLGYIIPNAVLVNENALKLRKVILEKSQIDLIRVFNEKVFENAQVESVVIVTSKKPTQEQPISIQIGEIVTKIEQEMFSKNQDFRFNVNSNIESEVLISKIQKNSVLLGSLSDICIGIQLGGSSGDDKKESFISNNKLDETYKKVLDGKEINTYSTKWVDKFVRYGNWLHRKRDEKYFLNPKLMIRQIGAIPVATFDDQGYYTLNTIYNLISVSDYSPKYFLGVINSNFGKWFWKLKNSDFKTLFPKIKKTQIEVIPINKINFNDPAEKSKHDKMVSLVEQMLALHKSLAEAKTPQDGELIKRQITSTDKAIDSLVYELYGLSEEEIGIVEG